jgi:Na+-translocating ferredoxin:NAD+ oxidoreductase RnfD subunit
MNAHKAQKEKMFVFEKIKDRMIPEGKILLYAFFFGLALGPALAFLAFLYMGTVPEGYTISRFYGGIRSDLINGVWIAWAVVLAPYAIFQLSRVLIWALKAVKDSIALPGR